MRCITSIFFCLAVAGCVPKKQCPPPIGDIYLLNCDSFQLRFQRLHAEFKRLELPSSAVQNLKAIEQQLTLGCTGYNSCRYDDIEYRYRRDKLLTVLALVEESIQSLKEGVPKEDVVTFVIWSLERSTEKSFFP